MEHPAAQEFQNGTFFFQPNLHCAVEAVFRAVIVRFQLGPPRSTLRWQDAFPARTSKALEWQEGRFAWIPNRDSNHHRRASAGYCPARRWRSFFGYFPWQEQWIAGANPRVGRHYGTATSS